jgi:hypothetical protein
MHDMSGPPNHPRFNCLSTGKPGLLISKLLLFDFLQYYVCGHAKLQLERRHLHLLRPTCSESSWLSSRIPVSLPEGPKVATIKQHINPISPPGLATALTTQSLRFINVSCGKLRQDIRVNELKEWIWFSRQAQRVFDNKRLFIYG